MFVEDFDVAVCGGGVAGVAAAIAAARRGCRTVLIEKTLQPGGLAASGLILVYLPLCDGRGEQLLFGLPEELMIAGLMLVDVLYSHRSPQEAIKLSDVAYTFEFYAKPFMKL